MNFILWKEKYVLGRIGLYFGGFGGEAELIYRIWGAKEKYFQGAEEFSFMDLGKSVHYFQGSMEHRPPPPWGLTTDACPTADPGVARSILARTHPFREIDRSPPFRRVN